MKIGQLLHKHHLATFLSPKNFSDNFFGETAMMMHWMQPGSNLDVIYFLCAKIALFPATLQLSPRPQNEKTRLEWLIHGEVLFIFSYTKIANIIKWDQGGKEKQIQKNRSDEFLHEYPDTWKKHLSADSFGQAH